MQEVIKIEGGYNLKGHIRISGSKNSTVALIPASIMGDGIIDLYGVADLSDVESLRKILAHLKVETIKTQDKLTIDTRKIENIVLDFEEVAQLRASYYFMGALLGKYKKVTIALPGGCYLGPRPIDLHIKGFESLGAKVSFVEGIYHIEAEELKGNRVYLDISSVGATINIMMAAVFAKGKTIIENAAKEPEIIDVASMLNKMGAKIRGAGTSLISIEGIEKLGSCRHEIIPDRIEAATYIILAAAVAEELRISNIIPQHLESLLAKLSEMGVDLEIGVDEVIVRKNDMPLIGVDIKTQVYPGFATDMQQPLTALLTKASTRSTITETIYLQRFKHCEELNKMGADILVNNGMAIISGNNKLKANIVEATDLRCGACLIIAALMADGVSEIRNIYHIERGYENIVEKLQSIGAKIWKEQK